MGAQVSLRRSDPNERPGVVTTILIVPIKRGRAGDSQRLEADADAGADAVSEPPLAVANHPLRLVRFYRTPSKRFVSI